MLRRPEEPIHIFFCYARRERYLEGQLARRKIRRKNNNSLTNESGSRAPQSKDTSANISITFFAHVFRQFRAVKFPRISLTIALRGILLIFNVQQFITVVTAMLLRQAAIDELNAAI